MTDRQLAEFTELFGADAASRYDDESWRDAWAPRIGAVTMVSDGFLPFRDNVDHAAAGATVVVEPGGSTRTDEVVAAAAEHGITHVQTGLRLFHH